MMVGNCFKYGYHRFDWGPHSQKNSTPQAFGIGVDIENVDRFENSNILKNTSFLKRVFTQKELAYCYSHQFPAQHLAARFAGKEAIIKALSGMVRKKLGYHDIQIVNNKSGAPKATIQKECFNDICISLSLSHTQGLAVAFVVAARPIRKELKKRNQPKS